MSTKKEEFKPDYTAILREAVDKPGQMMAAYRAFYNYSTGNQMMLSWQLSMRGIPIGPVATFKRWQDRGRQVKKGEKALSILMPVTFAKREKEETQTENTDREMITLFKARSCLFALSQTDGDTFDDMSHRPEWNKAKALAALKIQEVPFEMVNGNCQGYASGRNIAINPLAQLPLKTTFHEVAHIILGHTEESIHDDDKTPKNIREVEAESTALLCLESLGLPGAEFCRGYIQSWLGSGGDIPEKSAKRIMKAADQILKAGTGKISSDDDAAA